MEKTFEKNHFSKRLKSMLSVDIKRLFISPFFYIMVGISLVVPVLILVMTTMMDGRTLWTLERRRYSFGRRSRLRTYKTVFNRLWRERKETSRKT